MSFSVLKMLLSSNNSLKQWFLDFYLVLALLVHNVNRSGFFDEKNLKVFNKFTPPLIVRFQFVVFIIIFIYNNYLYIDKYKYKQINIY